MIQKTNKRAGKRILSLNAILFSSSSLIPEREYEYEIVIATQNQSKNRIVRERNSQPPQLVKRYRPLLLIPSPSAPSKSSSVHFHLAQSRSRDHNKPDHVIEAIDHDSYIKSTRKNGELEDSTHKVQKTYIHKCL